MLLESETFSPRQSSGEGLHCEKAGVQLANGFGAKPQFY